MSYTKNGPHPPSFSRAPVTSPYLEINKKLETRVPNKDETAVHGYGPTFMGSCRVWTASQSHLFCVVSALQLYL